MPAMVNGTSRIRCDATLHAINKSTILRLPATASENLPSRGQVAVDGTINGRVFQTVLEPDGVGGTGCGLVQSSNAPPALARVTP